MTKLLIIFRRLWKFLVSIGPGFFLVGYTIGTGSVVAMASAGSRYGLSMLWALALSCIFSFVLLEAYGRYSLVTGEGALYSYKKHFKSVGPSLALVTMIGLIFVEVLALIGIMGIISDLIREWSVLLFGNQGWNPLLIAACIIVILYTLLFYGEYTFFEKILIIFVSIMGISFILTMFLVLPEPQAMGRGLIPGLPQEVNAPMIIAALVGTTLTAPTFVVRSVLLKEKRWDIKQLKHQRKDAVVAAVMMFIVSGSVMACAAGTLYIMNKPVEEVITMVTLLEPLLGRFALSIFIMGILGAALSSIFPIVMLAPLLIGDYRNKPVKYKGRLFRILTGAGLLFGLIVPILGARPVFAMLISQLFQIFVLPVVVVAIMYLLNRKDLMGEHKAGIWLNTGLILTLIFSLYIAYQSVIGLKVSFYTIF
ncbi:MAG: Nramp family divalent metal transporter [Prolixibacteraceae bacterium]|nr:Nramp family divalent metal transporter [Prolixibacteraceae bacterium]